MLSPDNDEDEDDDEDTRLRDMWTSVSGGSTAI
jgi:hypothetical protein